MKKKLMTLLISFLIISIPQLASAATGFYFDGGELVISNNGASATIETQNPSVASGSSISAWSMVAGNLSSTYAQVGWLKKAGWTSPSYFYEYQDPFTSTYNQTVLGTASSGSNNEFTVGNDSTTMYFNINGITYGSTPLTNLSWSTTRLMFYGETHDTADQSPGSVTNPISFGNTRYKDLSNNWLPVKINEHHDLSTQINNVSSGVSTNWEIWDSRY